MKINTLELLDALGYADADATRYAKRIQNPELPAVLPRHDDAQVAVINLGARNGKIVFRKPGDEAGARVHPGPGTGAADVSDELIGLIERLGLVEGGAWTPEAETMLWRCWPDEWPTPDFARDQRVIDAIRRARDLPEGIRKMMDAFMRHPAVSVRRFQILGGFQGMWRMDDGWLEFGLGKPQPITIFYDGLAEFVCEAVMGDQIRSAVC